MPSALTIPSGRPDAISLDFDRLRAEGITHLENLATDIWTDFNAGNPGITIMEVLCYAITDLGYRTRLTPIADLAAGDGVRKMFFLPEEILNSAPVTPGDFRKLLIDVPGVKNAWLEEVVTPYDANKTSQLSLYFETIKSNGLNRVFPEVLKAAAAALGSDKEKDGFIRTLLTGFTGKIPKENGLAKYVNYITGTGIVMPDAITAFLDCVYKVVALRYANPVPEHPDKDHLDWTPFDPLVPQGLYNITLDLDDEIGPIEEKEQHAAKQAAIDVLHANRGLCHDYYNIWILDTENIAVCLDLQLAEDADEKMVLAEALYRLQDFLTPTVRFYSLAEMLAKRKTNGEKYRMDDIYNGPLLLNGFIDDVELNRHSEKPSEYIRFGDLTEVLVPPPKLERIDGLKAVNHIALKQAGTADWFDWDKIKERKDNWDDLYGTDPANGENPYILGSWRTENPTFEGVHHFKYKIKPELSEFRIKKGRKGIPYTLKFSVFKDEYDRILLERDCKYCMPQSTQSPPVKGRVRNDLAQYKSVQFDFPSVYRVGDHQWRPDAAGQKLGPMRELQAYLLFFDHILAAYLNRLSQTAHLLAVEQDISQPSYILPTLFEVPGMQQMLEARARIIVTNVDWGVLAPALEELIDPDKTGDQQRYDDTLAVLQDLADSGKYTTIPKIRKAVSAKNGHVFLPLIEDFFWQKYTKDAGNNFRKALAAIAESDFQRQKRRETILNHLLGRFGERFSDFVASLISADIDPEDNPGWFSFDDYLRDKAAYMMELPGLGYNQPKGYNYKKLIGSKTVSDAATAGVQATFEGVTTQMNNQPDVWNTKNVSGVKKRVCFLLGLTELKEAFDEDGRQHYVWESTSLLGEPPYTLDLVSHTDRGRPQFFLALRRKLLPGFERLDRGDTLMESAPFRLRKQALDLRKELYKVLDEKTCYQPKTDKEDGSLKYISFSHGSKELLFSKGKKPDRADALLKEILNLVEPRESRDYDGFHLLEHILLRPNDPIDELLEIPLNGINPPDPYSNIVTIVAPDWTRRFKHDTFRLQFEKVMSQELPAYVYPRFCYVDRDTMQKFEIAFKDWMIALATCRPNECKINETVKELIRLLEEEIYSLDCCNSNIKEEPPCK